MTLPGQISYAARVVGQLQVELSDPNNPLIVKVGFGKVDVGPDFIEATLDFDKLGLISTASTLGQLAFNIQAIEVQGSQPQIFRATNPSQIPGVIFIQAIRPGNGVPYPWTDGHTSIVNVTVCIVDNGPNWPQSNP